MTGRLFRVLRLIFERKKTGIKRVIHELPLQEKNGDLGF